MIITSLSYCRNGTSGAGYYLARLKWRADGKKYTGTAVVFDEPRHVAVNSDDGAGFRCEDFEPELRRFIESDDGQLLAFPRIGKTA